MVKVYNSRPIISNIVKTQLIDVLNREGLPCEYSFSDNDLADYIEKSLLANKIDENTMNKIYYDLIFFRQHKCCYLGEFEDFNDDISIINSAMEQRFGVIAPFIDFMLPPSKGEKVVAFEYLYDGANLSAVKIVFRKEIKTTIEESIKTRYIFIPIIIQIPQKRVIVMVSPKKDGTREKGHVYSSIAKDCLDKIKSIFNLNWLEIRDKYAQHNHAITLKFTSEICQMAVGKEDDLSAKKFREVVALSSKAIEEFLVTDKGISDLSEKSKQSSLLNIYDNVKAVIENAMISNCIIEKRRGISADSRSGYLSYIKFQDRAKSLMRMRGEYLKPITDSETFLSLRNDLRKYQEVSSIKIKWLKAKINFAVLYELVNTNTLMIRFYHDYSEEDYDNAIKEYEQFGQSGVAEV